MTTQHNNRRQDRKESPQQWENAMTSDDESEEMNRIREKLQRRCRKPKPTSDDETLSSDASIIEAPWNEDDDDDAFDAKLSAMNVFPSLVGTNIGDQRHDAIDPFVESDQTKTTLPKNKETSISKKPTMRNQRPNQHADEEEDFPFSDDEDFIAALESSEKAYESSKKVATVPKVNGSHNEEIHGHPSTQEKQESRRFIEGEPQRQHQTIGVVTEASEFNPSRATNPQKSTQPLTRNSVNVPQKHQKAAPMAQASQSSVKENTDMTRHRSESTCMYEYAAESQEWDCEENWHIHDSDADTKATPVTNNNADPFGFGQDFEASVNENKTEQPCSIAENKPHEYKGKSLEMRLSTVDKKNLENPFLDEAFGFSDEASNAFQCKSHQGHEGTMDQHQADPFYGGDATDEKNSEVDPSLYVPPPIEEIQQPIVHHLSPMNRPLQSRRKLPISQVFQGPVAAMWKNKFDVFNHVQSEIANMLAYSDDNVVVSAPTGAGKTAVFEMAMARFFEVDVQTTPPRRSEKIVISKRRKIVYISPSKALCEERFVDWSKRLSAMDLGIEIAVVTGDGDPLDAYHDIASSHFIITTPEKWDSLTRRWTEKFFLFASVKLFLVDEVHLIGDKTRGCCLEAVICRMKAIQRAASQINVTQADINVSSFAQTSPDAVNSLLRFVAVSATLPNIADIAMFFEANEAYTFDESYRPVPLTIHVIGQGKLSTDLSNGQFMFWKNLDRNVPELIFRFSNRRPSIVFCHSKNDCEKLADLLATTQNIGRRDESTSEMASRTRVSKLQRVLIQGVAYHHAGLELEDRRLIEESFTQGKIRVICATSTIAMGVNLPAHLVIIKGTSAYRGSGEGGGYQDIDQASLLQMIGRAGRPGFDSTGTAVIMTDNDSKTKFEKLASSGLSPAMSQLKELKLVETINTEVSQKVISSTTNALNWIKGTLYFIQLTQDPAGHGVKVVSNYSIDSHLHNICRNAIDRLSAIGTLVTSESLDIYPLPASHIMSQRLVDYDAMAQISKLPFDVSHSQVIKTISMIEGMQCPVRRNEKKALNTAHKSLKMYKLEGPLSKVRVQEPWQKTFVLLQAYIDDIEFEEHEYAMKKEMHSMVEYATRTLTAIEEFSIKGTKNGNVALQSMKIRRSLAVRLWSATDGMLQQIKGIGKAAAFSLHMNGISTFEDVMKSSEDQLEKAVSRPRPFGRDLRHASMSIMRSQLKISAQVDRTQNPHSILCTLNRPSHSTFHESEGFEKITTVTYTLLAYTDIAGGLFFVKQNILGPGSYQATLPANYGLITIQLVASIIGLDDTLELGEKTKPKSTIQKSRQIRDLGASARTRIRNAKSKPSNLGVGGASRDFATHFSGKENDVQVEGQTHSIISLSSQTIGSYRVPQLENTTVTPSPKLTPSQGNKRKSSITTTERSEPVIERNRSNHYHRHGGNKPRDSNQVVRSTEKDFQVNASIKRKLEPAYAQPDVHYPKDVASWRRLKTHQQKSQQRAFVRHSDNPFKNYKHDPNDSETYLDRLASKGKMEVTNSIIPPEGFHALRSIHEVPTIPHNISESEHHTAIHQGTLRGRGFHERPVLPIPGMLSQKARELSVHSGATAYSSSHIHNPPSYQYPYNPHSHEFAFFPDQFRPQPGIHYLSTEYDNEHCNGASLHLSHDHYPDTNFQGTSNCNVGVHQNDGQMRGISMPSYGVPLFGRPTLYEHRSATNYERLDSEYRRGMVVNSVQFDSEPNSSTTNTGKYFKQSRANEHTFQNGFTENDMEAAFF